MKNPISRFNIGKLLSRFLIADIFILNVMHEIFLTAKNNFQTAELINTDPFPVELTSNRTLSGLSIFDFNWSGGRYVAVKPSEHRDIQYNSNLWAPIVIEIELFGKHFKGFIVAFKDVTVKTKEVHCLLDSKIIDESKIVSMEYITNGEINNPNVADPNNPENIKKINYITDTIPFAYVRIITMVLINCVDCVFVEYIHPPVETNKEFYLKNTDLINIPDFKSCTTYYNNVIIEPSSILIIETITNRLFEQNNLVRFEDSGDQNYQGRILWTGKVNEVKAVLISLNENLSIDNIKPYIANKVFENYVSSPLFGQLTVCVPQFAVKNDLIRYITCSKTDLEVVDPNFKHLFETISRNEKLITFIFNDLLHIAILKWTGFIYNQKCIGCQLNCESETGSNGTYGSQELFQCPTKTGVILTADKINCDRIIGLCEFGSHKAIEWKTTKYGYKIYNDSSICCVENLVELEGMTNLKKGCKIIFDKNFIGICKFIGRINGHPTVGVETDSNYFEGNASFSDFLNLYTFKNQKWNFINANDISVGSFYTNYLHRDKFKEIENSIGESVHYYPDNNRTNEPIHGKLILLKRHGENNVCGIDLENENNDFPTNYFLEKDLFDNTSKHPVIDDIYKIECIDKCHKTETETCSSMQHCSQNINDIKKLTETIQLLFEEPFHNMSIIAKNTIPILPKEFVRYIHKNKSILQWKDIPIICELLYPCGEVETIKEFINNNQVINEIWPSLLTLFSLCIEENKLDIVVDALDGLEISEDDDEANSVCLQLAVKALENISKSDPPEYHVLYQPLMGKCTNKTVDIIDSTNNIKETFLTRIITNLSISESVVIGVLNLKQFNMDQRNSNKRSPLQIAIDGLDCNIVSKLFELGCKKDDVVASVELLVDRKRRNPSQLEKIEKMLNILIIKNQTDRINPFEY